MSQFLSRLGAILSLDTKQFVAGVNEAQLKSKEFKKNLRDLQGTLDGIKFGAQAAAVAMIGFGALAAKAANEISDLADANDTTIGRVLELKNALVASGGDAQKIGQLYSSFTNAIDGAAQGNDKLRDSFREIRISTRDLGFLSSDELMQKALGGLSKIDDSIRRNALAMELFGKAAKGVDFTNMANAAAEVSGKYDSQAEAIRAVGDAAQKLQMFFGEITIAAMSAIKPISDLINRIPTEDRINAMTKAFQAMGLALGVAFGVSAVTGVAKLAFALRTLSIANPWLFALGAAGTAAMAAGLFAFDDKAPAEPEATPGATPTSSSGTPVRSIEQSARDKMIAKYKQEIKLVKDLYNEKVFAANSEFVRSKNQLELDGKRFELSTNEFNRQKLELEIIKDQTDLMKSVNNEKAKALSDLEKASSDEKAMATKLYDAKIKSIDDLYVYENDLLQKTNYMRQSNFEAEIQRQQSWSAGWAQAMKEYTEASERASTRGAAAFQSVVSNMETALSNFVQTGKLNFKDLVGSIIKDLLLMQLKAQASGLFSMLFSAGKSLFSSDGGGIGSFAASIMRGNASGGLVDRPTIVGENGAELFVPQTRGTIIPSGSWQQAAANMGGGGLTVNGNYIASMSAIDTQSATQFLASNKNTIWAAYQSANRGVPISR